MKELKQFEVKGYEKMLSRILDVPLKNSKDNKNEELEKRILMIKN